MNVSDTEMADETAPQNSPLLYEPVNTVAEPDTPAIQEADGPAPMVITEEAKAAADSLVGTYTWIIKDFTRTSETKQYSEKFEVGTYFWRILVFPRGNRVEQMSVYLDAPEAPYTPVHLSPKAAFKLILVNQQDPAKDFFKEATHTFTATETDWGFTNFIGLSEVLDPARGFIVDDTIELRVEIRVQRDEKYAYDSKAATGFVGLKNQGATCYMNSLLQYMFHLPFFRKAVYHMPTSESDDPSKNIPLALQTLFYRLQYSNTNVSTKDLTKSFGWTTVDAFTQHDVQELNRVLCEKLEEKMKGTKVEKVITELFEGHTNNFVECVNVDYKSTRKESYMDLQLDVKGCKNIYDSFARYTEVETLDGQNQYSTDQYGMQDARKGVLFEDFPPVLQLQLKRFEYDFQRDTMVKINDRYEFYEELDLDIDNRRFLSPSADASVSNKYKLHSVLVHSGGVHGGHYYAFIRPDGKQWLRFDDDRVTVEEKEKALDEQFGGEDDTPPPGPGFNIKFTKYSNAYMLVYIRESQWDDIMCPTTKEDIAEHLRQRLEAEQLEKERRQKEKAEAHLYCHLKVARDADLADQIGSARFFDLVDHDKVKTHRVQKQTKFKDFKKVVEQDFGVPLEQQRYWIWSRRQNGTYRPTRILRPEEEEQSLMDLRDHRDTGISVHTKRVLWDLKLFLETPAPPATALHTPGRGEILLFLKLYDPVTETLRYAGRLYAYVNGKMSELHQEMRRMGGLPEGTGIETYEEIKSEPTVMCEPIPPQSLLSAAQLEDGDIIVFQRAVPHEEEAGLRHAHASSFLQYVRNRRMVTFKKLEEPKEDGITIELLRDMPYAEVTRSLAAKLGLEDHDKLRLTAHNHYSSGPARNPLRYCIPGSLEAMLFHANHSNDVLYYELLDMPLRELEQLRTLKVNFHNDKTAFVKEYVLRLPRESSVKHALAELRAKHLDESDRDRSLRLLEITNNKVFKVADPSDEIRDIHDHYWQLRVEPVGEGEESVSEEAGERLIQVAHFHRDASNDATSTTVTNFGDPFFLKIGADEPLSAVKERIQAKLGVPDEEFAKWKFGFFTARSGPHYLEDDEVLSRRWESDNATRLGRLQGIDSCYLGLEHEDRTPKRPSHMRFGHEKAVKIYN